MPYRGGRDKGNAGWMEEHRPRICKGTSCVLWFFGASLVKQEMGCGSMRRLTAGWSLAGSMAPGSGGSAQALGPSRCPNTQHGQ